MEIPGVAKWLPPGIFLWVGYQETITIPSWIKLPLFIFYSKEFV